MHRSKIEWVLNPDNKTLGWVWNPLTGCLNHVNGMCKGGNFPCYAYKLAHSRLESRYLDNADISLEGEYNENHPNFISRLKDPFYPRLWEDRLPELSPNKMLWKGVPIGIFVCDMSDLFGFGIPEEWTHRVIKVMESQPWHRFYLLTKQPQNLINFSPFSSNCWVGVTATNEHYYAQNAMPLIPVDAKTKYVSFEPLLGRIDGLLLRNTLPAVDWIIIGAQTKPYRPPKIEWVQEIVGAADNVNIPVFLKDNLKPILPEESPFYDVIDEDSYLTPRLRQEIPIA